MTEYVATFHTHLSAIRTQRTLSNNGLRARLAPVPRCLSASCGTCVFYCANEAHLALMDADVERVVECLPERESYRELLIND